MTNSHHQGAVEHVVDALGAWDSYDPYITRDQIVMQANDLAEASCSLITAYQAAEARVKELEGALEALDKAERLHEQYEELVAQADAEGWDETTGSSHLSSAWEPVAAAYKVAKEARQALLPSPGGEGG